MPHRCARVTVTSMVVASVPRLLDAAFHRIGSLDGRYLGPALALQLGTLFLKGAAWRNVLVAAHPGRKVPVFRLVCAYVTGAALNAFMPARGGDAAKVVLARAQIPGSSIPTVTGSLAALAALDAVIGFGLVTTLWATGVAPEVPVPSIPHQGPLLVVGAAVLLGATLAARRFGLGGVRRLAAGLARGFAVVRTPRRYALTVLPLQLAAWGCRVAVVALVLAAFRIDAGLPTAALIVTLSGVSTAVPVPGGAGTQQILAAYALRGITSAAGAVSFSLGLQAGITAVNTAIGIAGAMLLFGTIRPHHALRTARATVRRDRDR